MSIQPSPRTRNRMALRVLSLVLLGALVLTTLFEGALNLPFGDLRLGLLVLILMLAPYYVSSLDEVAQRGHYWATFWGASIGVTFTAILAVLVHRGFWYAGVDGLLVNWRGAADAQSGFLLGLLTTPVLILLAFACCWAFYWLRRR
jgi:hypothetical protein